MGISNIDEDTTNKLFKYYETVIARIEKKCKYADTFLSRQILRIISDTHNEFYGGNNGN